jgi:hypothetical protein
MRDEIDKKIDSLLTKGVSLSESEVSHLLTLIRKYLEQLDNIKRVKFTLLNFFCDWALHIEIDHSIPAMEILKNLNDTLVRMKNSTVSDELLNGITSVISFLDLQKQLEDFFLMIGLQSKSLSGREEWLNFIRNYIEIVLNCPLVLPAKINKKIQPFYDAISTNPLKPGMWVVGFAISRPDKTVFAGTKAAFYTKFLSLVILTSDTTRIIVPLTGEKILGWKMVGQNTFPYIME